MKPPFLVFIRVDAKYGLSRVHTFMCTLQLRGGASSARCVQSLRSLILNMLSAPWYNAKRGVAHRSKCPQANAMLMGFCTCGRYIWPTREGCKRKHALRTSHSLKIPRCLNSVRILLFKDVSQGTRKSLKSLLTMDLLSVLTPFYERVSGLHLLPCLH